jgi:hypothetical protein
MTQTTPAPTAGHQPPTGPVTPPKPPKPNTERLHSIAALYALLGWLVQCADIPAPDVITMYRHDLPNELIRELAESYSVPLRETRDGAPYVNIPIVIPGLDEAQITLFGRRG